MLVIGIDPGNTGALAAYDVDREKWVAIQDCPTVRVKRGRSVKNEPSPELMAEFFRALPLEDGAHAFLERVAAMPKQGVSSTFNFGMNFGMWRSTVASHLVPVTLVTPQSWKKAFKGLIGAEKDEARLRALQLWPHMASFLSRKKDSGRADAMLLAEYGRRKLSEVGS